MRWFKCGTWKAVLAIAGLLALLILMVLMPLSASAYAGPSGMLRATPTVDVTATMTVLQEEQLILQNKQLQQSEDRGFSTWLWNNAATIATSFLSPLVLVIGAIFSVWQWQVNRNDTRIKESNDRKEAQDKDLRAQAEERFKAAVTALGDEKENVQVGGAILLWSFLNPADKDTYRRYYTQIFDLAVAYLRFANISHSQEALNSPLPLTPFRQTLVSVFREVFPSARDFPEQSSPSLNASFIHLDRAYLAGCDFEHAYMRKATFRSASLRYAKLSEANLYDTDFSSLPESVEADLRIRQTYLGWADLSKADLRHAKFREANLLRTKFTNADLRETDFRGAHFIGTCLCGADLSNTKLNGAVFKVYHIPKEKTKDKIKDKISRVNLRGTNLNGADLSGADLGGADLSGTDLKLVQSLQGTNLRGVKGLTREQLEACKARGALIDGDIDETPSQLTSSLSTLSQNTDTQSSPPQESSSYPNKNEKSASLARQSNDAQAAATAPTQEVTPSTITDNKAPIQQNSDTLS